MRKKILLDTGPLVAFLQPQDRFHNWVVRELETIAKPLLTCEAVLSEACFLLRNIHNGKDTVMALIANGYIEIPFHIQEDLEAVRLLMKSYESVPMSFADACLVRMSEKYSNSTILTLDGDFHVYRKHRNQIIPIIIPD
ncbi:type II toxin-antitoxin system VapC family toxin [Crocosphaera sp.]|uniref:type II toxin-antitoxin system VapC family toxin n=1 Tax=Crocosphaera sp. TaxID=2729996 RepID=UPI003F2635FD|nr:PIN domain-containing protein [Crocosphaera sp.]